MLLTTLPIICACCFNIAYNTPHLQLFYTDIEVALITLAMWVAEIIELCEHRKYLTEELQEKRKLAYRERVPQLSINVGEEFQVPTVEQEEQQDSRRAISEPVELEMQAQPPYFRRRGSFPPSPRTGMLALEALRREQQRLPSLQFDTDGMTGEGEVSQDLPVNYGNYSFTERRPGRIRDPMHVNATPNRLNAAET